MTIRMRPPNAGERKQPHMLQINNGRLEVIGGSFEGEIPAEEMHHTADLVLGADVNEPQLPLLNAEVGDRILESLLDGYNCCLMSYGHTGTGKTYVLEGTCGVAGDPGTTTDLGDTIEEGLMPYLVRKLKKKFK